MMGTWPRIVAFHARRLPPNAVLSFDDYCSVAMWALWRAQPISPNLASVIARREIIDARRSVTGKPGSARQRARNFSLDARMALGADWEDGGEGPEGRMIRQATATEVRAAVLALPERERRLIIEHYWREKLWTEIALNEGLSNTRVTQLAKRALAQLRRTLEAA